MTSIAAEYASALYGLAEDEGLGEEIYPQVTLVQTLLGENEELLRVLEAPNIPREERLQVIETCFSEAVHPYLVNTMKLMCEKGNARYLKDLCAEYDRLYQAGHGIIRVRVTSAVALSEAQKEALRAKLEGMTGKKIRLENLVRAGCLGGVRLDFDGRQIDDTVRHRLDEMRSLIGAASLS